MSLLLATAALTLSVPVPKGEGKPFVFVEDTTRCACLIRGPWFVVGHLDGKGVFKETHRVSSNGVLGGGVRIGTLLNGSPLIGTPLYELKDGLLTPGTFDDGGFFVPAFNGKPLKFAEYKFSTDAPKIWNLPGYFFTQAEAEQFKANLPTPAGETPGYRFNTGDNR